MQRETANKRLVVLTHHRGLGKLTSKRLQAGHLNRASSVSAPANVMAAGTDQIFDH